MEIRKVEKNTPKYPGTIKKIGAVIAAGVLIGSICGGCVQVSGDMSYESPDDEQQITAATEPDILGGLECEIE